MRRDKLVFLVFVFVSLGLLHSSTSCVIAADNMFNGDFETGDLTGWTVVEDSGPVWDFQPTFGDNPTARARGQASNHEGDWWLGGYEKFQGPDAKGQVLGGIQGDGPVGILESIPFKIIGEEMSFLIGGGTHPWVEGGTGATCANLEINGEMVLTATGLNTETLGRQSWDISGLKGDKAVIRLYDLNAGGWGHLNFDDVFQVDESGNKISWEEVMAVESTGKLSTAWGAIKRGH